MNSIYFVRGVLRQRRYPRPCGIISRNVSFGRPERTASKPLLLPSTAARTRFAPSPTGYLHIGSLRTALYNYLLAKATGGQFLLRVEDTDQRRRVPDAEQRLYDDLKWVGLDWDEGPNVGGPYGPYKQSERLETYKEHADKLLKDGRAYRCFCTPEELNSMKKLALEESRDPVYNKACSHISAKESAERAAKGKAHCIRFNVKPEDPQPLVEDLVYGKYHSPVPIDDFILIKRDGFPTYHFANVVDDHLMKITHVIRGAEWLVSTPRHAALYNAFGWEQPAFAHVGLLVDEKKQKLSKRFGGFDLASWKEKGILPVALLNYVLLLGWSPIRDGKEHSEVLDMDEMIRKFHLRFTKGNVTVNNKSDFLQTAHLRRQLGGEAGEGTGGSNLSPHLVQSITRLIEQCEKQARQDENSPVAELGVQVGPQLPIIRRGDAEETAKYLEELFKLDGKPVADPKTFVRRYVYLLWSVPEQAHRAGLLEERRSLMENLHDKVDPPKVLSKASHLTARLVKYFEAIPEAQWTEEVIKERINPFISCIQTIAGEKPKAFGWQFLRWVVSGSVAGPAVVPSIVFLRKEETLARVRQAQQVAERAGF